MREEYQERLRDFSEKLKVLTQSVSDWISVFSRRHFSHNMQQDDVNRLCVYNSHVLSWLMSWLTRFDTDLKSNNAFQIDPEDTNFSALIERKRLELTAFLQLRHQILPYGIRDLMSAPGMPAHLACLSVTEIILQPVCVCQFLMPWVTRVTGGAEESNIKASTEGGYDGCFHPAEFIAGPNHGELIDVMGYLEYVLHDDWIADEFFKNKQHFYAITISLGDPAKAYLEVLRHQYIAKQTDKTKWGYYVNQLAGALHERSVYRYGEETLAAERHVGVIQQFYQLWRALPENKRRNFSGKKIQNDPFCFEVFVLTVFATTPGVELTDEELKTVEWAKLLRCSVILSSVFFEFLVVYKEWLTISIRETVESLWGTHGGEEVSYDAMELDTLKGDLQQALEESKRQYDCGDPLRVALSEEHYFHYKRYFALSSLIPYVGDEVLGDWLRGDHVLCRNQSEVLQFLATLPSEAMRANAWNVFERRWRDYFYTIEPMMILLYMLGAEVADKVMIQFDELIQQYLIRLNRSSIFPNLDRLCHLYQVDAAAARYFFASQVLMHASGERMTHEALIFCFYIVDVKRDNEFLKRISRNLIVSLGFYSPWHYVLRNDIGAHLLSFLRVLDPWVQDDSNRLNKNEVMACVFSVVLPDLMSHERLLCFWEKKTYCCFSFLSNPNECDRQLREDLMEIAQRENSGMLTTYEASCERVRLIADVAQKYKSSVVLARIISSFSPGFFAQIQERLNLLSEAKVSPEDALIAL